MSAAAETPANHDQFNTALCLWREARGEGVEGMIAVACVIRNRVAKRHSSYSIEVFRPEQFTSMSVHTDPEFNLDPKGDDPTWEQADCIAERIIDGLDADVTGGATLYWNPAGIESNKTYKLPNGDVVKFPETWNASATRYSTTIGHHIFLVEV